jgi:hypothetical protein
MGLFIFLIHCNFIKIKNKDMTQGLIDDKKFSRLIQENIRRKEIIQEQITTRLLWVVMVSLTMILIFI